MKSLSVVIPTLNCAGMIREHLASMEPWLDLASEVIVVDSHSEDSTADVIRQTLSHPGLRILDHPRGLYQSWNFGIAQTTGDWIYISTVGDGIERTQIERLLRAGEILDVDVVVSPPRFEFMGGHEHEVKEWPVARIIRDYQITAPTRITPTAAFLYAISSIPDAILGSSASNIYAGDHLRARPFPTGYSVIGDTAWSLQYGLETRYGFIPESGSVFCFHDKVYVPPDMDKIRALCETLRQLAMTTLHALQPMKSPQFMTFCERLMTTNTDLDQAGATYSRLRKSSRLPWYVRPQVWRIRAIRKRLRRDQAELRVRMAGMLASEPATPALPSGS